MVERLERDGRGLNLTEQVRDGILRHTGAELPATLEGRIVRLVDRIAYINHDIDDALRAGMLRSRRPARARRSRSLGETGSARIDTLVRDLRRALAAGRRHRAGRARWAVRWTGCARSCSSASTSARDAQSEQPRIERMLEPCSTTAPRTRPAAVTAGATEAERVVDYLADDRSLRDQELHRSLGAAGVLGVGCRVSGVGATIPDARP